MSGDVLDLTSPVQYNSVSESNVTTVLAGRSKEDIVTVVYSAGLAAIQNNAFKGFSNLKTFGVQGASPNTFTLPPGTTVIGMSAFEGCVALEGNLVITSTGDSNDMNELTEIKDRAFYGCGFTGTLSLSSKIEVIGELAFGGCENFTGSLVIPDNVTQVYSNAFSGCKGFDGTLALSSSMTQIREGTFEGCENLSGILTIPESVTTIEARAFKECAGFSGDLNVPETVTSMGDHAAFAYCTGFSGVTFIGSPPGLSVIPRLTFAGCTGIVNKVIIPEGVTTIDEMAFSGAHFLGGLTLPFTLHTVNKAVFQNTTWTPGDYLVIPENVTTFGDPNDSGFGLFYAVTGLSKVYNTSAHLGFETWYGLSSDSWVSVTDLSNTGTGTSLGADQVNSAIGGSVHRSSQEWVVVGSTLAILGDDTFSGFSALTTFGSAIGSFSLPTGLTDVGWRCFLNCTSLTGELAVSPNLMSAMQGYVFTGCAGFTSLDLEEGMTTIKEGSFSGCAGLQGSLTIPSTVTNIQTLAFNGCVGLSGPLVLPAGAVELGERCFLDCTGFSGALAIPSACNTIGREAFRGCTGFTGSLVVPSGVAVLKWGTFMGCTGFTGLSFEEGTQLVSIEDGVFQACTGLSGSVVVPSGVSIVGAEAFHGCSALVSLQIQDGVTELGPGCFQGCSSLGGTLTIPSTVTRIDHQAFDGCDGLASIVLPSSVTSIGAGAFPKETVVYTEIPWNTSYGTVESKWISPTVLNLTSFNNIIGLPAVMMHLAGRAKASIVQVILAETLTVIEQETFEGFAGLVTVGSTVGFFSLPNTLVTLGPFAFAGCASLVGDLHLPLGIVSIGEGCFRGCSGFVELTFANNSSLKSIGAEAFAECQFNSIATTLPASVESIGDNAFGGFAVDVVSYLPWSERYGIDRFYWNFLFSSPDFVDPVTRTTTPAGKDHSATNSTLNVTAGALLVVSALIFWRTGRAGVST